MAFSESLAIHVRQVLGRRNSAAEKKVFGGVGFLFLGNMGVGIWENLLIDVLCALCSWRRFLENGRIDSNYHVKVNENLANEPSKVAL
jgi:hypothetical protein